MEYNTINKSDHLCGITAFRSGDKGVYEKEIDRLGVLTGPF